MTLLTHFNTIEQNDGSDKQKTTILSVRLTSDERARLEELAGAKPLGAYIREH